MTHEKLLHQYLDTGALLPKYQLERLNTSKKKTYLRRRVLQAQAEPLPHRLKGYELETYKEVDRQALLNYLEWFSKGDIDSLFVIEADMYYNAKGGEEYAKWQKKLANKEYVNPLRLKEYLSISRETLDAFIPHIDDYINQRGRLLRKVIDNGSPIDEVHEYITRFLREAHKGTLLLEEEYEIMPTDYFDKYLPQLIPHINTFLLPDRLRENLLDKIVVDHDLPIPRDTNYRWNFKESAKAIEYLIRHDIMRITPEDIITMTSEFKRAYINKNIKRDKAGLPTHMDNMSHLFNVAEYSYWINR